MYLVIPAWFLYTKQHVCKVIDDVPDTYTVVVEDLFVADKNSVSSSK